MKRITALAVAACLTLMAAITPAPVVAQAQSDAQAIEQTIRSQLFAMQEDNWEQAFSYASPMIQGIFQSPENFSRMVMSGYPMVWRPKRFKTGGLTDTPRGPMQTMFFEDQSGRLFIADYLMQNIDGVWRINGVQIRPAPEENA